MSKKNNILKTIMFSAAAVTAGMALYNQFIYEKAKKSNKKEDLKGTFYSWRYGNIYYEEMGEGSPLILLHDIDEFSSSEDWKPILNDLSKKYRVYSLDLLGCGHSDKPGLHYTNYFYVKLVIDFIRDVVKEPVTLVSMGSSSAVAMMSALEDDSLIQNIKLVNPDLIRKLPLFYELKEKWVSFVIELPILGSFIYNLLHTKNSIRKCILKKGFSDEDFLTDDMVYHAHYLSHNKYDSNRYLFISNLCGYTKANVLLALKNSNVDIELIVGEDTKDQDQIVTDFAKYAPEAPCTIIENAGFYLPLEAGEDLIELL